MTDSTLIQMLTEEREAHRLTRERLEAAEAERDEARAITNKVAAKPEEKP